MKFEKVLLPAAYNFDLGSRTMGKMYPSRSLSWLSVVGPKKLPSDLFSTRSELQFGTSQKTCTRVILFFLWNVRVYLAFLRNMNDQTNIMDIFMAQMEESGSHLQNIVEEKDNELLQQQFRSDKAFLYVFPR